jgi:hypothetical protein
VILWYGPHAVGSLPLASLLVMWLLRFIRMSRLLVRTYTRALTSLYNTVDYRLHPCSSHWLAIILAKFVARRANRGWTSVLAIAREAFSRLSCSRSSHLSLRPAASVLCCFCNLCDSCIIFSTIQWYFSSHFQAR